VNISEAKQLAIQIGVTQHEAKIEVGKIDGAVSTIDSQNKNWSYTLNTTNWIPDKYVLHVFPADPNTTWSADALLILSERPPSTQKTPLAKHDPGYRDWNFHLFHHMH
jgi:hypothetical protein